MLTGMSQSYDLEKAKKAGADVCMTKPFDTEVIIKTVEKLLNSDSGS
jgi:CheY-like chemotaxis protein